MSATPRFLYLQFWLVAADAAECKNKIGAEDKHRLMGDLRDYKSNIRDFHGSLA